MTSNWKEFLVASMLLLVACGCRSMDGASAVKAADDHDDDSGQTEELPHQNWLICSANNHGEAIALSLSVIDPQLLIANAPKLQITGTSHAQPLYELSDPVLDHFSLYTLAGTFSDHGNKVQIFNNAGQRRAQIDVATGDGPLQLAMNCEMTEDYAATLSYHPVLICKTANGISPALALYVGSPEAKFQTSDAYNLVLRNKNQAPDALSPIYARSYFKPTFDAMTLTGTFVNNTGNVIISKISSGWSAKVDIQLFQAEHYQTSMTCAAVAGTTP